MINAGMAKLSDAIVNKEKKLTKKELEEIKRHPLVGEVMFMNPAYATRPLIKVIDEDCIIDLTVRNDLHIEDVYE